MTYKIKLLASPNNETRITLYPEKRKSQPLREIAADFLGVHASEVEEKSSSTSNVTSADPLLDIRSEFKTVCSAMNSKRTEFGKYAKTRIMRAAGALDRNDSAPWHYLFLTATLPGNSEWAKWAIADQAPWIINTFKAWLSKRVKSRYEFYVWEMQDRGALHFHYCIHIPDREIRERITAEFRLEWCRILDGVAERTGVNVWGRFQNLSPTARYCIVQTLVQEVDKSVAAYMAGYCGIKKDKHSKDGSIPYYPKRWFGISRHLSALVDATTEEEIIEYPNYRVAKLAFDEFNREFEQEEIKGKIFCHTVGRGETGVHYHTPKIQAQLWQSRKTMQYKMSRHPRISSFVNLAMRVLSTCSELETESQLFRKSVSSSYRSVLTDSLYRDSARRGILRDLVVRAIEGLYLDLGSNSSLPPSLVQLSRDVRKFAALHSQYFHQMQWDKHGYLCNQDDFAYTVDTSQEIEDTRTTADAACTGGDGIATLGSEPIKGTDSPPPQLQIPGIK